MRIIETPLDFDRCNEASEVSISGCAELVERTEESICLKTEFTRSFNTTYNGLGQYCYKDPYKEVRFENYPATIKLYSHDNAIFENIYFVEGRILLDTTITELEFDDVEILLDKENVEIKIIPPLYKK